MKAWVFLAVLVEGVNAFTSSYAARDPHKGQQRVWTCSCTCETCCTNLDPMAPPGGCGWSPLTCEDDPLSAGGTCTYSGPGYEDEEELTCSRVCSAPHSSNLMCVVDATEGECTFEWVDKPNRCTPERPCTF